MFFIYIVSHDVKEILYLCILMQDPCHYNYFSRFGRGGLAIFLTQKL